MGEFTANNGGSLHGKSTTTLREFEGCPGPYDKDTNLPSTALHPDSTKFKSAATSSHGSSSVGAGRTGSMGHAENVHGGGQAVGGGNYTYGGNARMTESAATGAGGASSLRAADAADSVVCSQTPPLSTPLYFPQANGYGSPVLRQQVSSTPALNLARAP